MHLLINHATLTLVTTLHQESLDVHVLEVAVAVQQNPFVRTVVQHLDDVAVHILHARVAGLRNSITRQAKEELTRRVLWLREWKGSYDDVGDRAGVNRTDLQTTLRGEKEKAALRWD